jgi:hypothetical protein
MAWKCRQAGQHNAGRAMQGRPGRANRQVMEGGYENEGRA